MNLDETKLSSAERRIYRSAREMLADGVDAATFSARLFGPDGQLTRLAPGHEQRQRLVKSPLYRWLKAEYNVLNQQDAAGFEQELRSLSGRLTVVVPKSLHAALKSEAVLEGVSLSELIRLKLNVPYRQMTDLLAGGPRRSAMAVRKR